MLHSHLLCFRIVEEELRLIEYTTLPWLLWQLLDALSSHRKVSLVLLHIHADPLSILHHILL